MELLEKKKQMQQNQVLSSNYSPSENFYSSDLILKHYLKKNLSEDGQQYMHSKLEKLGAEAAGRMNELSLFADKNSPELIKRNQWGETINEISFHPSYWKLMETAVESEMFRVKWEPQLRNRFQQELHALGFASGYLYAMSEGGQFCPLCMTDGVARLIDKFCEEDDKNRLLPHIWTNNPEELFTGAMYLTEKAGGSDVGANMVKATQKEGRTYLLNGEKWFCSNANAEIIFALARTNENASGIKGLSIFLVEKFLPGGKKNPIDIIRLKDKLGVRSMASAECMLTDTVGKLVGEEFEGFKIMAEMINLSRLYNSVAALSSSRRALIEAFQFLSHRTTFGKIALEHALVREKLTELGSLHIANFYLTWRAIKALDTADNGNEKEAHLLRLLTPMVKKCTAEKGVYIIRESMELMGGMGYIEDTVIPKLMRDSMVLPIWEGAGNIMILDMLRATAKSNGFEVMCEEISKSAVKNEEFGSWLKTQLEKVIQLAEKLPGLPQDEMEVTAKPFFEKLTGLYQMALLIEASDEESRDWVLPALHFLKSKNETSDLQPIRPLSRKEVEMLVAWEV
ncbi:MAG: acyl-CoA dehydrogenase [Flavobacteriales bacterium]|nr:MAG: acyl-CoA dehydrogenase [Flavobacteriales bacterium]